MTRYFMSPDGRSFATTGDGPIAATSLPATWTEVTAEEYTAKTEELRQAADEAAATWIAADGDVPPPPDGTPPPGIPISDLPVTGDSQHDGDPHEGDR
ncbi:hypothetical protein [Streptomyces misionensis]|uniref:hypothetical protein n=1 Tax=Streptomyces misionensis TaxID=67331 RepID=UPI0033A89F2D